MNILKGCFHLLAFKSGLGGRYLCWRFFRLVEVIGIIHSVIGKAVQSINLVRRQRAVVDTVKVYWSNLICHISASTGTISAS